MTATKPLAAIHKIVAVSDSLTNDQPDNYLALLGAKLHATTVANAHGGWTTRSYFKEKLADVAFAKIPADADLFIILIGSNDLFEDAGGSKASIAQAVEGVQKLATHLLRFSPKARIMLVAPPTVALRNNHLPQPKPQRRIDQHTPQMLARLSIAYRQLARQRHWLFADLYPVLSEDDFVDAAHPSAEGNQKMAEALARAIQSQR